MPHTKYDSNLTDSSVKEDVAVSLVKLADANGAFPYRDWMDGVLSGERTFCEMLKDGRKTDAGPTL